MQFRQPEDEDADVNLTPLIDVVFLLLIFFMVTTTFERQAVVEVQLPKSTSAARLDEEQNRELELVIDERGAMYLNGIPLANSRRVTLRAALLQEVGERRDLPLVIRAAARTAHQNVIRAMDVAGEIGLARISFATDQVEEDEE